jgi:hypothetical protein
MGTVKFGKSTTRRSQSEAGIRAPILDMPKSWILACCLTIYALSFVLLFSPNDDATITGFHRFLARLFPFGSRSIGGLLPIAAWAANPIFWLGAWLLHHERERLASVAGFLSLLLGLVLALLGTPGLAPPHDVYSCYYLWLASFASLAIGGLLTGVRWKVRPE